MAKKVKVVSVRMLGACSTGPAKTANLITVNATSRDDARASFSNYGSCTDIFAPGDSITSIALADCTGNAATGVHETFTVNASSEANTGTWTLRVTDVYTHDTGVVVTWTITP